MKQPTIIEINKHKIKVDAAYKKYIYSRLHTELLYRMYVAAKRSPIVKPSGYETFP